MSRSFSRIRMHSFILCLLIVVIQLFGCMLNDAVAVNLLKMIDSDRSINLDANVPSYEIRLLGEKGNNLDRVQLSELNTYANARTAIDNALNIKKSNRSESSKVGCLYVIGGDKLSGNTCLLP